MSYKYRIDNLLFTELQKNAVVPKFQRKLVWSNIEKKNFITTLSNGHPFGSILIYKYEDEQKYSIIDGLQRFSTIEDYIKSPEKYISFDELTEKIIQQWFSDNIIGEPTLEEYRKEINKAIIEFIQTKKQTTSHFNDLLEEKIPQFSSFEISKEKFTILEEIKDEILDKVKHHLDVNNLPIPTIIFTGEVEELATVFENLNKGGKKTF